MMTSQGPNHNKRSNLSADIFSALKERLIRWEYAPGHRFTEEQLCEEFGVSRSPVREALRMLVENGLVEKVPHRGYSVKQIQIGEVRELYDVRLALEIFAVEQLAEKGMLDEDWQRLHQTWSALLSRLPDPEVKMAYEDERFHEALAAATGNQSLARLIHALDERLHFVRITDITTVERLRTTCRQHLEILESIAAKDPVRARRAVRANIEHGRSNVEAAFKEALVRAYSEQRRT